MMDRPLPKVTEVEVVGTQPKPVDLRSIEFIANNANITIDPVTYIVKIALEDSRATWTGLGFSLYVGDQRIDKFAGYKDGIYFKVNDPRFFEEHGGKEIRLSLDEGSFFNTGKMLPHTPTAGIGENVAFIAPTTLPTQEEVLR